MTPRTIRVAGGFSLGALALVAIVFFQRQNAGLQPGGEISLPKMLWLAYAIGAWFVVPPFLAWDARLGQGSRRVFRVFWISMLVRGLVELGCMYGLGWWHPLAGIAHDLFSIGLLLALRRRAGAPRSLRELRARRFSGSLVFGLLAETTFAVMFLQSGVHASGTWFAAGDASWTLANGLTWLVLAVVLPDLGYALRGLWHAREVRETPAWCARARLAAVGVASGLLLAVVGLWTWMARVEARASEYQRVGVELIERCMELAAAFEARDEGVLRGIVRARGAGWAREEVEPTALARVAAWQATGEEVDVVDALLAWHDDLEQLEEAVFKTHLIDEFASGDELVAQVRFEVHSRGRVDHGLLRWRLRREEGHLVVRASELVEGTTARGSGDSFVDRASQRGLDFAMEEDLRLVPGRSCDGHACFGPREVFFQTMRHAYAGAAAADVDGDGHDDVFLCSGGRPALFRNTGEGCFEEVTRAAGLEDLWHVNCAGFADLDNDGDQDLFLGAYYGPNHLFRNTGAGHFERVTLPEGLADLDHVTCFSFFDADADGLLDLYLGRMIESRTKIPESFLYARNGEANRLYHNEGDLALRDVTAESGVGDRGLTLCLTAADYDLDGDQDVYVANDFGRNVLYRNRGDGRFDEVSLATGSFAIGGSMSASWGDYDNDGRLDLYVAAIRSNQRWFVQPITVQRVALKFLREGKLGSDNPLLNDLRTYLGDDWDQIGNYALAGNYLLRQGADGRFSDVACQAGARPAGWYWSSGFFDVDHDADLDVLATNGWVTGADDHDL